MIRLLFAALIALTAGATQAAAEENRCRAYINGDEVVMDYERDTAGNITMRERLIGWPRRGWNALWGAPPVCNSEVIMSYLSASLEGEEIDGYCLSESDDGWLLVPGERNFRGRCSKTTCDLVNTTASEAGAIGAAVLGLATDPRTTTAARKVIAVEHSSGIPIVSGSANYILGALGASSAAVTGVLTAPATMIAAVTTVAVVGSAVYVCSD